ncbi:helical bundle domain-containing protein [Legionella fallonii]|uniref:Uncharacterized protein n=1 Tax=Legionella fallonii LLAP-10 TaxID=1212491 RepID=A0A098G7Z8_9GAMM|nr:helical bundle domain-containing protein [Legionella fallonii]CEG58089.1 conserved protein of unknown function [Legionella fallonii LLAP-10]
MLSSSKEYLQALREGKYLLFLEWPQFIAAHYCKEVSTQDADATVILLVYEWLNNGYCEEDAKKIALLCAVSDLPAKPIRGTIDYSLTAISIAVFQCMLYQNEKLQELFLCKETLDMEQVIAVVDTVMSGVEKLSFEKMLAKQQSVFYSWVAAISREDAESVHCQISPIAKRRYITEEYSLQLGATKQVGDLLKNSRLSVVKRLARYLNEQSELTEEVHLEITTYVAKIKELQPAGFEKEYLQALLAPSLLENTWEIVTNIGLSFFKLLQSTPSPPVVVEQHETKRGIK